MKKHVTCAVVLGSFTAGTASAAVTVFEKENFTYTLGGDVQIQLLQDSGIDEDVDVNYDDGELKNRFTYDLGDSLSAFAELDLEIAKGSDVSREEAYVGLQKNAMSFWVGASDYVTDDFGVERNIDVGDIAGDAFVLDNSEDLLAFNYSTELYSIGLSHDLEVDEDESSTDLMLFAEFQGFEVGLAFQSATNVEFDAGVSDADTFGVSLEYSAGMYGVGVAFSSLDIDEAPDTIENVHVVGTIKPWSTTEFNLGYEMIDAGDENAAALGLADVDSWYLNAIYKFPQAKGVSTFAEIGQTDIDGVDDIDAGFLAGLRLTF